MPVQMLGRPILHKQVCVTSVTQFRHNDLTVFRLKTAFGFYRPGAIALANTFADIPFSASRILVYNIIVYLYERRFFLQLRLTLTLFPACPIFLVQPGASLHSICSPTLHISPCKASSAHLGSCAQISIVHFVLRRSSCRT